MHHDNDVRTAAWHGHSAEECSYAEARGVYYNKRYVIALYWISTTKSLFAEIHLNMYGRKLPVFVIV